MPRLSLAQRINAYYSLIKPGVTYGNLITTVAGFLLASHGHINPGLFAAVGLGSFLIIAAACVINNYFDQDIDAIMERTKRRAIVSGLVPGRHAVIMGIILGIFSVVVLALWTNWLVVMFALIGFFDYVFLYGMWSKRISVHGTLVGSISGAMPIVMGYVAVTNRLDLGVLLVFAILFFWQMPEFYSIAIFRRTEYKAAHVPVITVVKGVPHTKKQIFTYTVAFVIATLALTAIGITGIIYTIVMGLLGAYWIWLAYKGLRANDDPAWARRMFRLSLIVLIVFSLMISLNGFLL